MKKRILALMLTLAMVLSVLPGAVFAADTADNDILTYADLADIDKDIVIPDEASATAELSVADAVRALLLWTGMTEEQLGSYPDDYMAQALQHGHDCRRYRHHRSLHTGGIPPDEGCSRHHVCSAPCR